MSRLSSLRPSRSSLWRSLPTAPGVYFFKDAAGKILYVGKAKNLKNRVKSYFQSPVRLGPKTSLLVSRIISLEYIEVISEVEALLLESSLIRKLKPGFNSVSKDDKTPYHIHLTREKFPRPLINHQSRLAVAGPFLNRRLPSRILRWFRTVTPFCSLPRPVKRPCLYSHLGLCRPCPGDVLSPPQILDYRKNIARLRRLLKGDFISVNRQLETAMSTASKNQNYESAALLRDRLTALNYLQHPPSSPDLYLQNPNLLHDLRSEALASLIQILNPCLPYLKSLKRIEMYDVSHLRGGSATAAMAVAVDGRISHRDYRHFTVRTPDSADDVASLLGILNRRLKRTDWPAPDLIVLDGGKPQLSILKNLDPNPYNLIPILAIAKRIETLIIPSPVGFTEINLPRYHPGLQLLIRLRDEAHRFSRRLHHLHRKREFLSEI